MSVGGILCQYKKLLLVNIGVILCTDIKFPLLGDIYDPPYIKFPLLSRSKCQFLCKLLPNRKQRDFLEKGKQFGKTIPA